MLQFGNRNLVGFAKYYGYVALEHKHITVEFSECSTSEVLQLKYITYWSGALSFQSILSVLPPW